MKTIVLHCAAFACFLFSFVVNSSATQTTYTFYATADSYIVGEGSHTVQNSNYGISSFLRVGNVNSSTHILLTFSQSDIQNTIAGRYVVSASLDLHVETNFNNWGGGGVLEVYPMSEPWSESHVTWMCPEDTDVNQDPMVPDCDDQWEGGYYFPAATNTRTFTNSDLGWRSFNVTPDVQSMAASFPYSGWIIFKQNASTAGSLDFSSIQGGALKKPRLTIIVDDTISCDPSDIESLDPGILIADGTNKVVTAQGAGLDSVTQVLVDGNPTAFSHVDSSNITFIQNYSADGEHTVSFASSCVAHPLNAFALSAVTPEKYTATVECKSPATAATRFSVSKTPTGYLCYKKPLVLAQPVQMIGYSGDFALVTWNSGWNSTNDANTGILDFMNRAQYTFGNNTDPQRRGVNLLRMVATGCSCNDETSGTPATCRCDLNPQVDSDNNYIPETMPFKISSSKYVVDQLSTNWKPRLKTFLSYADRNGMGVVISLFDENNMGTQKWDTNPWNPVNNNSGCNWPSGETEGLPSFYNTGMTCGNGTTLGQKQMSYVQAVVSYVLGTKACGPTNAKETCKNVIFEVMNEARFDTAWSSTERTNFITWHKKVAQWVKNTGGFMVTADVKVPDDDDFPCDTTVTSDYCALSKCSNGSCTPQTGNLATGSNSNMFNVFWTTNANINIVSLHWRTWEGDVCGTVAAAKVFGKPVLYDDDAGGVSRNDNCSVENWAELVSECSGLERGQVHFYHTGDGTLIQGTACTQADNRKIDCGALNGLGDGAPDILCGFNGVVTCDTRPLYCEQKTGGCPQNCRP